jgi:hypothetical protein
MPLQDTDRDTTWQTTGNNRTWTLAAEATIWTNNNVGILDEGGGNRIRVLGSIRAENAGVQIDGNQADLYIGKFADIFADDIAGVVLSIGKVVMHGSIVSDATGIQLSSGSVRNSGRIEGDVGIESQLGSYALSNSGQVRGWENAIEVFGAGAIVNKAGGTIIGDHYGILQQGLANLVTISNAGRIVSDDLDIAIECQGRTELTNTGTIIGDVVLSGENDRIDTRGGLVRGTIWGGEGDDLYLISRSDVRIVDEGTSFADTVHATASYTLAANLDNLKLLGKESIHASGNAGANRLNGNAGDNTLAGWDSADRLAGSAGNDILAGGAGADIFVFQRGFDVDRIVDFTDTVDVISSDLVLTRKQFENLDVRQAGVNTVISFGQGDKLVIENFDKDNLDFGDFAV